MVAGAMKEQWLPGMRQGQLDAPDTQRVIARIVCRLELAVQMQHGSRQERALRARRGVELRISKAHSFVRLGRKQLAQRPLFCGQDIHGEAARRQDYWQGG